LTLERVQFLPLGMIGSTDKITVRFRQSRGTIPIAHGAMNVLFDARGRLLSIQTRAIPRPVLRSMRFRRSTLDGQSMSHSTHLRATSGFRGSSSTIRRSFFVRTPPGNVRLAAGQLAWRVNVRWEALDVEPVGAAYFVDAHDGAVLAHERTVHEFDVSGTVRSMATPGNLPDESGNASVSTPMRSMRISSSAGNATTDASGNFTIVGASAPLSVTVTYQGPFNDVQKLGRLALQPHGFPAGEHGQRDSR